MMELKSENKLFFGILPVLVAMGTFITLGFTGLRTIVGITLIMFLPFYVILNNFSLKQSEKVMFSLFLSIVIFPSLAYWLGFIVPFKVSIFAVFTILLITAFLIKKFWKK